MSDGAVGDNCYNCLKFHSDLNLRELKHCTINFRLSVLNTPPSTCLSALQVVSKKTAASSGSMEQYESKNSSKKVLTTIQELMYNHVCATLAMDVPQSRKDNDFIMRHWLKLLCPHCLISRRNEERKISCA